MSRRIAIVASMQRELAPLLRRVTPRTIDGVHLYELPSAIVVIGGMGRAPAERAANIAVKLAGPELLISAGFAGALTPKLKVGDVVYPREVLDDVTGERYLGLQGDAVLVTALRVMGRNGKKRLAGMYAASAVEMEAAVVAQVAKQHGLPFAAVKVISDELEFPMPPVKGFVDAQGRFRTLAFAACLAVRPKWWIPTLRLARNSKIASENLSAALNHLSFDGRNLIKT
jgi:adenosylhomocysteine nucleosidase